MISSPKRDSAISNFRQLPTAIVLVFVAGGFVALNLQPRNVLKYKIKTETAVDYKIYGQIGWPLATIEYTNGGGASSGDNLGVKIAEDQLRKERLASLHAFFNEDPWMPPLPLEYNYLGIAINLAALVLILAVVATPIEILTRRREARAP